MSDASGLDYPIANPDDIAPAIFRAVLIQSMALEYFKAMQGSPDDFSFDEAMEAAMATWDTEWSDQPQPRTLEAAIAEVQGDLEYWGEE